MRFLVLSLSLLLLVGFSSTANAAPNSGQISGFDAFRGLMDKIVSHWGATHRVSEAKWQKDRQYCNETMSTLMMEADKYKDILATANNTVANWTAKAEKAKQSLAPLEKRLSELKIELAPILNQIKHGEETRAIEGRVNSQKINDTKSLMAAVEVIVEKLKDGNTDNPRFKEELEATKSLVSDPEVQSLIEGAVSAVEKIPVYLETNLYRLQKLFWLLNNELQRYIDEVVEQEKLLDATWEENRRPLDEKREGLEKQVTAASEDLVDGKKVIEQANEQIQKAQAVLDGVTPKKLEATNAELQLVEERCKRRRAQFERELATSKGVDDTVQALDTIVSEAQRRDDGTGEALGRLVGLQIPAPTVCCRKCVSSYACGDTCVSDKDQCDLPVGSGCACGEDDPRLAAFEQAK